MADSADVSDPPSAEALKNEGNELFKAGKYADAVVKYGEAIDVDPEVPAYYSNRAFCHIKMENHGLAIADASIAIELDKTFVKAYHRRGSAYMALAKYKEAFKDFKSAKQLKPADRDVLEKFKAAEKEYKREQFEKAIHADEPEKEALADTIDIASMSVDESYAGPRPEFPLKHDDVVAIAEHMKARETLHSKYVYQILIGVRQVLKELPSMVEVPVPEGTTINVCGDTHGQYYDLLNIFKLQGWPSESNPYLFNGDFVDRGSFSVEVVLLLLTFKLLYPNHLHMTRGNHETLNMNRIYGFEGEVKAKYSAQMFQLFLEVFQCLPICYVLGGHTIVLHGGLFSRDDVTLADLRKIERFREPPDEGLMSEAMWSDPQPLPGRSPSKRGVGLSFGPDVTEDFLKRNGLKRVVRSHEVKDEGYEVEADGKLITVFSAPNYCDQMGNKGAMLHIDHAGDYTVTTYDAVPHPPIRPMAYSSGMGGMFGF